MLPSLRGTSWARPAILTALAILTAGLVVIETGSTFPAAAAPFTCDSNLYYTKAGGSSNSLYARQPDGTEVTTSIGAFAINTIAMAPDGRLFGFAHGSVTGSLNHLYTIGSDGTVTDLGAVSGLPNAFVGGGAFGPDGTLYVAQGPASVLFKVDVSAVTATSFPTTGAPLATGDLAYVDGALYASNGASQVIDRIDPTTGLVTSIPLAGQTQPTANVALWSIGGHLYGESPRPFPSALGDLFEILDFNTAAARSVDVGDLPRAPGDGASCLSAPSPFLDAADDSFGAVDGSGGAVGNVYTNDTRDGASFTSAQVTATLTDGDGITGAALTSAGDLTIPANVAPGNYSLTYQLCRVDNTSICDPATVTFTVNSDPSLTLDKTADLTTDADGDGLADAGDVITYTLTLANSGNVTLHGVIVSDPMPGLSAITPSGPTTLTPGESATYSATYQVTDADLDTGGAIVNHATGTGTSPTGQAIADEASSSTPVDDNTLAQADLVLTKTADRTHVNRGDKVTFTVTVTDRGPSDATGVKVVDTPRGLKLTSAHAQRGRFAKGTWILGHLGVGESVTLTLVYRVTSADAQNTAVARGDVSDPVMANNSARVVLHVTAGNDHNRPPPDSPGVLPNTGSPLSWNALVLAAMLILAGAGAIAGSRRYRPRR